ncbi:MAG TPA: c-type cytochrome [Vicinamibacterales bacterium]|nr:c-type cytochrome [Vicinamibacterales bacterium]
MRRTLSLAAAACLVLGSLAVFVSAQEPQGGRGAGARGGGAGGRQGGNPNATFPAQQRPPGDPALIARGNGLYGVNCRACHGVDLRGGDIGGPNLLRSQLALNDQEGELIGPVITGGRQTPGMPPMPPLPLPPDDLKAIAAYIHSVQATMQGQGSPPAGARAELNILVGDAAAGQAYFKANCSSCHSVTGDLRGIGGVVTDPVQLQNLWVGGGRGRGGRGGAVSPESAARRQVTVTVTTANGQKAEGRLDRIDDFLVVLTTSDGTQRSFGRTGDVPKVEVRDPLEGHRRLLGVYSDRDIHNVTAYLVTLK